MYLPPDSVSSRNSCSGAEFLACDKKYIHLIAVCKTVQLCNCFKFAMQVTNKVYKP